MLTPSQVAEVLDTGLYASRNIYNMDEVGFDLSTARRTRRVGPKNALIKSQTSLSSCVHITVIAAISTQDAPVPPFLIYPGKHIMSDWVMAMDRDPVQMAVTTQSGYSNSNMTICWLTECFDPSTRGRANGALRLLFLDVPDIHTSVEFLEACWSARIVCIILPANLSGIFQPLDVDFFNHLKLAYHQQVDEYQFGSTAVSVPKGFFYRWHQRAWAKAANTRQIRSAWAKAHLFPRQEVRAALSEVSPEPQPTQTMPETPCCPRTLHALDICRQNGQISPSSSARKVRKGLETVLAEKVMMQRDIERRDAAAKQDREARSHGKRQRFPKGHLFDQRYQQEHAEELAARKEAEEGRKRARRAAAQAVPHAESSNSGQRRAEAVSTDPQNPGTLASIADEI